MRYYLAVLFSVATLGLPWAFANYPSGMGVVVGSIQWAGSQVAAVVLAHEPKTLADIVDRYNAPPTGQPKVRVFIIPGHEPNYGGAEYQDPVYGHILERDMTAELGADLQGYLAADSHYQTFMARDATAWNPILANYFQDERSQISAWATASKQNFSAMVADGSTTQPIVSVDHVTADPDAIIRLYGMTKWANENDIDIEIHIHFNDNPGHAEDQPGKYSGFAVYVPASQYDNSSSTKAIADAVFKRLARYNPVSDLPGESTGIVDDPELIAVGANNTADAASMLIEYSYIYEQQLDNPATRSMAIKDLAYQTYLGLKDFFEPSQATDPAQLYDTSVLPYTWKQSITSDTPAGADIFALQTALIEDGEYPPGKDMNDCPRTGKWGSCTKLALQAFQDKYNITGETGMAGPKTIAALNQEYGIQPF